jgi:hypothetical protein
LVVEFEPTPYGRLARGWIDNDHGMISPYDAMTQMTQQSRCVLYEMGEDCAEMVARTGVRALFGHFVSRTVTPRNVDIDRASIGLRFVR